MRTAAEAMIKALVRADRKRRGFFVMKRTASLVLPPGFLELNAAADNLDDVISAMDATSMKEMGKVMAEIQTRAQRRSDMAALSALVKARLSG